MSKTISPIELEKHLKLELERNKTMGDDNFIRWMYEFSVGTIAEDNSRKVSANLLMNQYKKYLPFVKKYNIK